jgi:hypothetical protein
MGINVYWKDERGVILATVEDSDALAQMSSVLFRQTGSACVRFIDPAGDVCFNQLQIPVLASEIRSLLPAIGNPRWQSHLQAVLSLVEGASKSHTYVWFQGD